MSNRTRRLELYNAMILLLEEAICVLDEEPAHYEYGLCWAISVAYENLVINGTWTTLVNAKYALYRLIRNALGGPHNYVNNWLFETHGVWLTNEELKDYRIRWATAILEQAKKERDELLKITTPNEYTENHGAFCPVCQSNDIEGESFEVDAHSAWQPVRCLSCGAQWNDVYKLTDYDNLRPRSPDE